MCKSSNKCYTNNHNLATPAGVLNKKKKYLVSGSSTSDTALLSREEFTPLSTKSLRNPDVMAGSGFSKHMCVPVWRIFINIWNQPRLKFKPKDWLWRLKKTGPQKVNFMETFVMSFLITTFPEFNFLTISFTHCIVQFSSRSSFTQNNP